MKYCKPTHFGGRLFYWRSQNQIKPEDLSPRTIFPKYTETYTKYSPPNCPWRWYWKKTLITTKIQMVYSIRHWTCLVNLMRVLRLFKRKNNPRQHIFAEFGTVPMAYVQAKCHNVIPNSRYLATISEQCDSFQEECLSTKCYLRIGSLS